MALTNTHIQNAKPRETVYRLSDGGALWLEVRPTGTKIWRYRYKIAGKGNIYTIGEFAPSKGAGHTSLEMARRLRDQARTLVRQGTHPSHDRRSKRRDQIRENENTFQAIAEEWTARKEKNWASGTARQIKTVFKSDVFPAIGKLPIRTVTPADVLKLINAVNDRGANTFAHLIRQWVSAVYRFAIVTLRAESDPAAPLNGAIERNKPKHSKALSKDELKRLLDALHSYGGDPATMCGLELILLTFVRTVELRAARWEEVNFAKAEWRIPADRMKMRQEHIVPLSRQALAVLKALYVINGHREYLFPNKRDYRRYITATTLNRALERMGFMGEGSIGFSAHGFRSTACTMLNEAGFRGDVIERQLAHQERDKVRASYNHAQYLDERRIMMQVWADMVDEIGKDIPNSALHFVQALTFQAAE
jgi:integrase